MNNPQKSNKQLVDELASAIRSLSSARCKLAYLQARAADRLDLQANYNAQASVGMQINVLRETINGVIEALVMNQMGEDENSNEHR